MKKEKLRKTMLTFCMVIMCWCNFMSINVEAAYDGAKAANYAKKYAKNYNTSYPKFGSDCTNFVSQCAVAGGLKMKAVPSKKIKYKHINDIFKTKDYWDCRKWTRTTTVAGIQVYKKTGFVTTSTWSVVAKNNGDSFWGFYNYMKSKGANCKEYSVKTTSKLNTFIKECKVGDILQKRTSTGSNKTHSVIVTEKNMILKIDDGI